jgi:hypothetical protein
VVEEDDDEDDVGRTITPVFQASQPEHLTTTMMTRMIMMGGNDDVGSGR